MTTKHDQPKKIEKIDRPKQDKPPREVRHDVRGWCFTCNEVGHMKIDYTCMYFKPVTNFYYDNCHGYGQKEEDYKKPKFNRNNENSRMFRNTNPIGNERGRSHSRSNYGERPNGERK